jgi:Tol biopolymer transport system component
LRAFTRTATFVIAFVLAAGTLLQPHAQSGSGKHPFTFEDMMKLKRVSGPAISPDGRWVLFSAVDVDLAANKKTPHLWIVPLAGGEARQITFSPTGEDRGRFSPDGRKFLFTSPRAGSSQIWVSGFDSATGRPTGDSQRITTISTEADGALWSPDGRNIVFLSEVYPDASCDDACN